MSRVAIITESRLGGTKATLVRTEESRIHKEKLLKANQETAFANGKIKQLREQNRLLREEIAELKVEIFTIKASTTVRNRFINLHLTEDNDFGIRGED